MYDALAIANFFLDLADNDYKPLDPMKLQKLVYLAHGWYLAIGGAPLIKERIEAWPYGPVVPSLYQCFKQFGASPITGRGAFNGRTPKIGDCDNREDEEFVKFLLSSVWSAYGDYTAVQLSTLTHQPGSPWAQVKGNGPDPRSIPISDETIRDYFKKEMGAPE